MLKLLSYPDIEYKLNVIPEGAVIACDSETTGLNVYKGHLPFLYSFSNTHGEVSIVEAGLPENREMLKNFFENTKITKIFHNMKFDIKMIRKDNYDIKGRFHDTMIMAKQLDAYRDSFKLEDLVKYYNDDFKALELEQLKEWFDSEKIKAKDRKYNEVPDEIMNPYAAVDAYNTAELFQIYKEPIKKIIPMYKMDMGIQEYLIEIEDTGVLIDHKKARENAKILKEKYEEIQKSIKNETEMKIEADGGRTLMAALFSSGVACKKLTESGIAATDSDTLLLYKEEVPFIKDFLKMRDVYKAWKDLRDQILSNKDSKHLLHTNFNLSQARTGRFSSSQPNLQNQKHDPRIREVFICKPSYTNFYFDYSQVEYRLFAHFAKDKHLIKGFHDPEFDIHALTGKKLGIPRSDAKTFNFSVLYGSGAKGLSEKFKISKGKAQVLLDKYHEKTPSLKELDQKLQTKLRKQDYFTDPFGKQYHIPKDGWFKAVNYLIQGTACNIFKKAMLKLRELLKGTKSHIIQLIHDEIIFEIHDEEWHLIPLIKKIMEDMPEFDVPLPVDIQFTETNWSAKINYLDGITKDDVQQAMKAFI